MKKNIQYKKKSEYILKECLLLFPILFITSILPFICNMKEVKTYLTNFSWFSNEEYKIDFFLYYKQLWFLVITGVMLIIIVYYIYQMKGKIKIEKFFIPLLVYGMLVLSSTLLSPNRIYGFRGIYEQYESVFVQLGYILVVFYCYYFVKTERQLKIFIYTFLVAIFFMGLLGTLQTFEKDFFKTSIGFKSLLPSNYWSTYNVENLTFTMKEAYMTLYNPNYVGVYATLTLPIMFCLIYTSKEKFVMILSTINMILIIISLFGSGSEAGLIAIIIGLTISLVFIRKYLKKKWYISVGLLLILFLAGFLEKDMLLSRIQLINNNLFKSYNMEYNISKIEINSKIDFTYKGEHLYIRYDLIDDMFTLDIMDDYNHIEVIEDYELNRFFLQDEKFKGITIIPIFYGEWFGINVTIDGTDWLFTKDTEDGNYAYINRFGKQDKIITADSAVFTTNQSLASGRGYIWSRTIPLLKDKVILGSGAETFALEFPQQDYVGLYNNSFSGSIITKPHNLYLQQGVQFGVMATILFIIFVFIYLFTSIKLYLRGNFNNLPGQLGVGIFISMISYMIVSITNDSSITVSPIFWSLIGIGIVNNKYVISN